MGKAGLHKSSCLGASCTPSNLKILLRRTNMCIISFIHLQNDKNYCFMRNKENKALTTISQYVFFLLPFLHCTNMAFPILVTSSVGAYDFH